MKLKWMALALMFTGLLFAEQYEDRWFYVSRMLNNDQELADVEELVRTAGKVKLNGMLSAVSDKADHETNEKETR